METSPPGTIEPIPPREHRARPKQVLLGFGNELVREIAVLRHGDEQVVPLSEGLADKPQLVELLFAANLPHIESHQILPLPQDASAEAIVQHHLKSHDGYRLNSTVIDIPGINGAQLLLNRPDSAVPESVQVQVSEHLDRVIFRRIIPEIGIEDVILTAKDDLVEMRRERKKMSHKTKAEAKIREPQSGSLPLHIQYLLEAKGLQVKSFPPLITEEHDEALYRRVFEYLDHATRIQS